MSTTQPAWLVEPLEGGVRNGCFQCPDRPNALPMEATIGVGFGMACVTKGADVVWAEGADDEDLPQLATFESAAKADPDHDWRVRMDAPLWGGEWQRQGEGQWLLIDRNEGFA